MLLLLASAAAGRLPSGIFLVMLLKAAPLLTACIRVMHVQWLMLFEVKSPVNCVKSACAPLAL